MANLPNFNLPADLPVNWQPDQIVSPDGISVGLTAQHGYNTLSQYINNAQTALNQLREFLASAGYVDTAALNTALGRYLPLAGGTMSGILDMNGKRITSVGTPSATTDAANKSYVDSQRNTRLALSGGTMSGSINHGGYRATNLGTPSASTDGATKGYVDNVIGGNNKYWLYTVSGKYTASVKIYYVAGWVFPAEFNYNGNSGAFSGGTYFNPQLSLSSPKPIVCLMHTTSNDLNKTELLSFTSQASFPAGLYTNETFGNYKPHNTLCAFYYVGFVASGLTIIAGNTDSRVTGTVSGPYSL